MTIVHHLTDTEYHAHSAIGSSTAKLALRSLQLVRDQLDGLCQRENATLRTGRDFHGLILEPERTAPLVREHGPINPKTGSEYGRDTKAWAEWAAENPGAIIPEPWVERSIDRQPGEVRRLLATPGASEVSVFAPWTERMQVKARPDRLADRLILDLKTIDNIDNIDRAIVKWGYWFQAAWYRRVLFLATAHTHDFVLIFAEKNPPYRWRIVDIDAAYRLTGDAKVTEVAGRIEAAIALNHWSDADEIRIVASQPDWMDQSEFEADEEGGISL
jgi:hypothetical protein